MSTDTIPIAPELARLIVWAVNYLLAIGVPIPLKFQLENPLLRELEDMMNTFNRGHWYPLLLGLSPSETVRDCLRSDLRTRLGRANFSALSRQSRTAQNYSSRALCVIAENNCPPCIYTREAETNEICRAVQDRRLADIVSSLTTVFNGQDLYKQFLRYPRSDSETQTLLNLFQKLLDLQTLESTFRHDLITATQRLAKATSIYPVQFSLDKVELATEYPLASGSFADVYKGVYKGQNVCLKVIRLYQPSQVQHFRERFCSEAILWRQLKHPNILPFYGVSEFGSRFCMVSRWIDNGDINKFLQKNPLVDRVSLALDVAEGVKYLHENNIVHGDLKGANVLVDNSKRALLADFGLSSATDPHILRWESGSQGGTTRWQAPELFGIGTDEIAHSNRPSDIYALACVIYEIFTGNVPFFEIRRESTVIHKISRGKRPSRPAPSSTPWTMWGLTDPIWKLMEDCWATEPSERPTAEQIIERLGREVIGVDKRHESQKPHPPSHFRQMYSQDPNYPTIDELETLLWGGIAPVPQAQTSTKVDIDNKNCDSTADIAKDVITSTCTKWVSETLYGPPLDTRSASTDVHDEVNEVLGFFQSDPFRSGHIIQEETLKSYPEFRVLIPSEFTMSLAVSEKTCAYSIQTQETRVIMGYIHEAQRIDQPPKLWHEALWEGSFSHDYDFSSISVNAEDHIFAHFRRAHTNNFLHPFTVNSNHNVPLMQGIGLHTCPSLPFVYNTMPELFEPIFRLRDLRGDPRCAERLVYHLDANQNDPKVYTDCRGEIPRRPVSAEAVLIEQSSYTMELGFDRKVQCYSL